jgi:hypothetical protein
MIRNSERIARSLLRGNLQSKVTVLKNYETIIQKKADNLSIIFYPHPAAPIKGEELYLLSLVRGIKGGA